MSLNATSAFSMGTSGSLSAGAADAYNTYMGNLYNSYTNLDGWLGETLKAVKVEHQNFMNSRLWEFSKRINKDGHFVGRFEIGYLSEAHFQSQATGLMRNYIMANPNVMRMYLDERISGFEGEFSALCHGLGRDNYYYNKAIDGMNIYDPEKGLSRTTFHTSRDAGVGLSMRERMDISRTWTASNAHIARDQLDMTDPKGGDILTLEQVEEAKKKASEEE